MYISVPAGVRAWSSHHHPPPRRACVLFRDGCKILKVPSQRPITPSFVLGNFLPGTGYRTGTVHFASWLLGTGFVLALFWDLAFDGDGRLKALALLEKHSGALQGPRFQASTATKSCGLAPGSFYCTTVQVLYPQGGASPHTPVLR
jgi:hypothetical protein